MQLTDCGDHALPSEQSPNGIASVKLPASEHCRDLSLRRYSWLVPVRWLVELRLFMAGQVESCLARVLGKPVQECNVYLLCTIISDAFAAGRLADV